MIKSLIYLLLPLNILSSILVFKFKKQEYSEEMEFIDYFISSNLITTIKIGSPEQNIPTLISSNTSFLIIPGKELKGKFKEDISDSYKKRKNDEEYQSSICYSKGFLSQDTINFEDEKGKSIIQKNFPFYLPIKFNFNYPSTTIPNAYIGFSYKGRKDKESLIRYLSEQSIINQQIFTLKFTKENEGEIIIGDFPHIYDNKYSEEYFISSRLETSSLNPSWEIKFNKILFGTNNIIYLKASLDFDLGVIYAPEYLKTYVLKDFFNDKLKDNICQEIYNEFYNITYYSCNKKINIKKFPSLTFTNNEFQKTFEITYKDLWLEHKDKYYCLIVFPEVSYSWILGSPFLKKTQFIFQVDRGEIGYYTKINAFSFPLFLIILFLIIIFGMVIILLYKKPYLIKKKKASELLETLDTPLDK